MCGVCGGEGVVTGDSRDTASLILWQYEIVWANNSSYYCNGESQDKSCCCQTSHPAACEVQEVTGDSFAFSMEEEDTRDTCSFEVISTLHSGSLRSSTIEDQDGKIPLWYALTFAMDDKVVCLLQFAMRKQLKKVQKNHHER
jgi:hypothetical protein